jgi:UDP-N-acetylmuramate: L-alanyl-gamma-D-glutamyl-meso-diaminopimelate ligase
MASLAGMLQQRGYRVTGSDAASYPPMSDFLAKLGIAVAQPFSEHNLQPRPGFVVVGNAISRGNVELEAALNLRLALRSLPQLLHDEFLAGHERLVVAGTHGKTTTSSLLAWLFSAGQRAASFLIGGIPENFGSSFQLGSGPEFILEGDEYDTAFFDKGPKFLHYFPDGLILTSVEFDHADIYRNLDEVKTAFKRLVNLVPQRGVMVAWDGNANVYDCVSHALCKVEHYGFGETSTWRVADIEYLPDATRWRILREGLPWGEFEFSLAGEYNVLNATAAAAMASHYGITVQQIAAGLRTFRSVKRRLEVRSDAYGVTIIDDFAHHPTAIAQTLKALRARYAGRKLWAILEPRSNTLRRRVFQNELAQSLSLADQVVIAAIFKSEAIPEDERLHAEAVVEDLQKAGIPAQLLSTADAIVDAVAPTLREGDVVAILSNGGFGGIYEKLPARLKQLHQVPAQA